MLKRAMDNPKVTLLPNTVVESWLGNDMVLSGAILKNATDSFQVYLGYCC